MSRPAVKDWLAISDLHGYLPYIQPCDVLLIGGDVCPTHDHSFAAQWQFLKGPFTDWLKSIEAKTIIGIAGNHDFLMQSEAGDAIARSLPWTYLCDETVTVDGVKLHGSPWTPQFMDWAFMEEDDNLPQYWDLIPDDVDVLLTHGPAYGTLDMNEDGQQCGSTSLAMRMMRLENLRLHVTGHIHEARGVSGVSVNVSYLNARYHPQGLAINPWEAIR